MERAAYAAGDPPQSGILVETLTGTVRRDGERLELSPLERLLSVAIAVQPHPVSGPRLAELVYSEDEPEPGRQRNVVKVYVYRLRRRVAEDFIIFEGGGYRLGPGIRTDIGELQPLTTNDVLRLESLTAEERGRLEGLARMLRSEPPEVMLRYEWYATLVRKFARRGQDLTFALAKHALREARYAEAVRLARELVDQDPIDEEARELVIRAQLGAGNRAAAVREFRYYQARLHEELQAAPSSYLAALVR